MRRIVSHTVTSILITSWPVFSSSTFKSKRFITPRTSGNNGPIYDYIPLSELQLCAQCVLKVNGVSRRFFPAKREAPQNYAQLKKCYNIIISWFGGYNIYDLFFFFTFQLLCIVCIGLFDDPANNSRVRIFVSPRTIALGYATFATFLIISATYLLGKVIRDA